jgi:hypothetical protein
LEITIQRKKGGAKDYQKNGTKIATTIVEKTRVVCITKDHEWYFAKSSLCGNISSKLCATKVIVNPYLVKGLTTCRE